MTLLLLNGILKSLDKLVKIDEQNGSCILKWWNNVCTYIYNVPKIGLMNDICIVGIYGGHLLHILSKSKHTINGQTNCLIFYTILMGIYIVVCYSLIVKGPFILFFSKISYYLASCWTTRFSSRKKKQVNNILPNWAQFVSFWWL